jgi:hypothetical protein
LVAVVAAGFLHLHSPFLHPQGSLHLHSPFLHPQGSLHSHFPAGHLQGVLLTFLQVHFPAGHLQGILLVLQQAPVFVQPPFFRLHWPAAFVLEQAASLSSHPTTKIKPINTNIVIVRFIIVLQKGLVTQQGHAFIIGHFVK